MPRIATLARRWLVSTAAVTRTTGLVARLTGVRPFLPELFVLRYSNMGGLDPETFARELSGCRSFSDRGWCRWWDAIAEQHLRAAQDALVRLVGPTADGLIDEAARTGAVPVDAELGRRLGPAAVAIADQGPGSAPSGQDDAALARAALDSWIAAITYLQVSAFPGHTPARTRAYWRSRRLFDALLPLLTPHLGVDVEVLEVPVDGDVARGYLVSRPGGAPQPTVLITNGLEGTAQELLLPLLRYRDSAMATFVMEMPGSYAYHQPMTDASEQVYRAVLDRLATDPRLDGDRLGMVGVSFGGYWSTRMAAADDRLRCVVSCGAPTHRSFGTAGSIGIPQIILQALKDTTGSRTLAGLSHTLHGLSLADEYGRIEVPLLVVNGDHDTLLSTQDSIDLAAVAPRATLRLFPDDDHCAMGHYREWLDESQDWLAQHLLPDR